MRKRFFLPILFLLSLSLFGCQNLLGANNVNEDGFVELTKEQAHKIVWDHLDRVDFVLREYYDADHQDLVTEDLLEEKNDTEEIKKLLKPYRGAFRALIDDDSLEPMMRKFIYDSYYPEEDELYLEQANMHTRFEIVDQEKEEITVSFVRLADEKKPYPVKFTLTYVEQYDEWLLSEYEIESLKDQSLQLTVQDMKNYYRQVHFSDADLIEKKDNHLILKITPSERAKEKNPYIVAINIDTSLPNKKIKKEYE